MNFQVAVASFLPVFALLVLLPDEGFYPIPFPWVQITLFFQGLAVVILLAGLLQTGIWSFLGFQQLVTLERGNPLGAFFEERKLVREYGEAYIRYRQSTPMFIPWKICSASPSAA